MSRRKPFKRQISHKKLQRPEGSDETFFKS
jgi:hypothetical protein